MPRFDARLPDKEEGLDGTEGRTDPDAAPP